MLPFKKGLIQVIKITKLLKISLQYVNDRLKSLIMINTQPNYTISEVFKFKHLNTFRLPFFISKIEAGFPSPADDFIDQTLDLNELLIERPTATFFVRVNGNSMIGAGIHSGDILIVDRAVEAANNKIVIASLNGELTLKRIKKAKDKIILQPENPLFHPIHVTKHDQFEIWGTATHVIHSLKR
ncbi:hypothetical protein BVY03_02765 [bacterium K02(2017)]|nr:hypothetical protein BVY03_02765 [bacterium K02(2017)]